MTVTMTRRALFGRLRGGPPQQRPPWSRAEPEFSETCTRCDACIEVCPTGVLTHGHSRYPIVDFDISGCSLCGSCAAACPVDCFDTSAAEPWAIAAQIGERCIEHGGVACRVCESSCERQAIQFRPRLGGGSLPTVKLAGCTGCGSCVSSCPVGAISMGPADRSLANKANDIKEGA